MAASDPMTQPGAMRTSRPAYSIGPKSGNRFSEKSNAKTKSERIVPIPFFGAISWRPLKV
ncbi:hypothetical protein BJF91_13775 [Allorhizobium taibaishanense]|uniref:Uncharacterized protein n=1 Tax=Allorhizobium taibaishanense TaxID=887144 RepID=A0A1Q9A705_9HYPH|nr:hypothetical protein BJF91_13775 [Allorhizobium taibaishanense]